MLQKLMFETEGNMEYHLKYFLENGKQRCSETGLSADSLVEGMIASSRALKYLSEKVTKFLVKKLSTSEVISQKPYGGGQQPPPPPLRAFRVKSQRK